VEGYLMVFKEHGLMLYVDRELYVAFNKFIGDKGLGRSYGGLLLLTEGLHNLGYLSNESYEVHHKKYSRGLIESAPVKPSPEQKEITLQIKKTLRLVLEQFDTLKETAKAYHIKTAQQYLDEIPEAREILKKAGILKETLP
jgi:hypothetical protein